MRFGHYTHSLLLVAVFSFLPLPALAGTYDYSRDPATLEVEEGTQIDFTLSYTGATGFYGRMFLDVGYGACVLFTTDPQTHTFEISDIPIGTYTEIFFVRYSDSSCTSYLGADSLEYDGGAPVLEITETPPPDPPDPDVATSTPDSFPGILFYSFIILMFGLFTPVLIGRYIDYGR